MMTPLTLWPLKARRQAGSELPPLRDIDDVCAPRSRSGSEQPPLNKEVHLDENAKTEDLFEMMREEQARSEKLIWDIRQACPPLLHISACATRSQSAIVDLCLTSLASSHPSCNSTAMP